MQSKYKIHKTKLVLSILLMVLCFSRCKKLIEVNAPTTSINAANVYNSDATAAAVLTGVYTNISKNGFSGGALTSMSLFPALSADELTLYGGTTDVSYIGYYTNALTNLNTISTNFWNSIYPIIFVANSAIEGLTNSTNLTTALKQQLLGEAKFIRAFCYFYLVNLYGDVPLVVTTDYTVNAQRVRTPMVQVWQQIIADLKDAQSLLSTNYLKADALGTTTERVRPTKWAATALLARVYLYSGDYVNAETQATAVINNSGMYGLTTLNNTFLKNSNESIWQLQPVTSNITNTQDAYHFILPPTGPNNNWPVYLSTNLLNSFEAGDQRKTNWLSSVTVNTNIYYYPYKYKVNTSNAPVTEYLMILRLGEQYLIRAEARAQQGNSSGAASDLNTIRTRAGLANTTATTQSALLAAIQQERKIELFSEWGHRWLDLKRTSTVDAVMSVVTPQKGGSWSPYKSLYPIPQSEIGKDPNLVQNAGY